MSDVARGMVRPRNGVAALFFQQGWIVGGWALQIPLLKERLAITEATLGLVIVAFGLGSLVTMLSLGPVIARIGSRAATRWGAAVSAFFPLAVVFAPDVWTVAIVAAIMGGAIGGCDLGMNAQGVEVERRRKRSVMSAFHGFWSIGTLIGAVVSGPLIEALGPSGHAWIMFAVAAALALYGSLPLVDDSQDQGTTAGEPFRFPTSLVVWTLALVTLTAYVVEGAAIDWSALMVVQDFGAPLAWGGVALGGLQVTMAAMRFLGDRVRDRFGSLRLVVGGGIVAALGYALAGSAGFLPLSGEARTVLAALGFGLAGLGLANIVPIAFAAAGNVPGVPRGISMAVVTGFGYAGILLAPSLIGFAAEVFALSAIFVALALLPLVAALVAPRALSTRRA